MLLELKPGDSHVLTKLLLLMCHCDFTDKIKDLVHERAQI